MIDLSTPELRSTVTKERFRRLALVAVLYLVAVFVFAWILLSPSFFMLALEQKELARERFILEQILGLQRNKEIAQELSLLDSRARSIVENEKLIYKVSPMLARVLGAPGEDVSLRALSLRKGTTPGISYVVDVSGSASTREKFLSFMNDLKSRKDFLVESPLANVLKEKEVDFKVIVSVKDSID